MLVTYSWEQAINRLLTGLCKEIESHTYAQNRYCIRQGYIWYINAHRCTNASKTSYSRTRFILKGDISDGISRR